MVFCMVVTTYSVGRMVFCMLQQPIRWAEWSFTCCNNLFGGQNGLLHGCNNPFGGQNGLLHVATQFRTRANLCCIVGTTLPPWPNGCFPNIPAMCYKQMER